MADNFIFKESTARDILQMLDDWKRKFPMLRPRQRRRSAAGGGGGETNVAKLFEVESPATGPGIYNCLPTIIDSSEFDIENQFDIIDVKTEGDPPIPVTETELVLNLDELANITDAWALFTGYSSGDWTRHNNKDYQSKEGHCAGGCVPWVAGTWTIEDRCRYAGNAYLLTNSDKTGGDTTPPDADGDWVLDNDEPGVGNNWENYWKQPAPKLAAGAMLIAFKVTDDEGNTRLVGRVFGIDFIKQFFESCS